MTNSLWPTACNERFGDTETFSHGLYIHGEPGVGKSHLAATIMRDWIESGHTCLWLNYNQLLLDLRACFGGVGGLSEKEVLRPWLNADLLVIDDIGDTPMKDHESAYSQSMVLHITDSRCNSGRATIMTSNYDADELGERYERRIASRLLSYNSFALVGPDRRQKDLS